MYSINDYNYDFPAKLIAQQPAAQRDRSRLLFLHQAPGRLSHHKFYEIYDLLSPSDTLVVNNTQVVPGRLFGRKETGGKAEVLILDYARGSKTGADEGRFVCECLIKTSKRPKIGSSIYFDQGLNAVVMERQGGIYTVQFSFSGDFEILLDRIGNVPLPPYIKRSQTDILDSDRKSYQTIYASKKGAVAAPTAGLHFTEDLLEKMKGIRIRQEWEVTG